MRGNEDVDAITGEYAGKRKEFLESKDDPVAKMLLAQEEALKKKIEEVKAAAAEKAKE